MKLLKHIIVYLLTLEARLVLKKWKPHVIVVSGSVGKTSTKDAIFHVLALKGSIRKSQKSYNSEIGIPLTILGLENAWRSPIGWLSNIWQGYKLLTSDAPYPSTLVLEVGSDHPGDITKLMQWLVPDVAVITSLPEVPVHVENFATADALRAEDSAVLHALKPSGVFVGNVDDARVQALLTQKMQEKKEEGLHVTSYGFGVHADVRGMFPIVRYAQNEGVSAPVGMQFGVKDDSVSRPVYLPHVLGTPACSAVLGAIAVGLAEGMQLPVIVEEVMTYESPPGRMRLVSGKSGSLLVDDSYNSSPIALEKALYALQHLQCGRKIAILGDMLELGEYSEGAHWQAGRQSGAFLDLLITVGKRARLIAEGAKSAGLHEGRIRMMSSAEEAGAFMLGELMKGDVILVKGSQGSGENRIRLEHAVKILMAHPDDAPKELVRQEAEWTK